MKGPLIMVVNARINYIDIGKRVRERRLELRWTQERLAEEVDVSSSFIGHIERGEKIASIDTLFRLCARMDISMDYLVFGMRQACDREGCPLYDDLSRLLAGYTGKKGASTEW